MASLSSTSTQPAVLSSTKSRSRSAGESQWESDDCRHYRAQMIILLLLLNNIIIVFITNAQLSFTKPV